MNNTEHENIITEEHKARHDIRRYRFRPMEINNQDDSEIQAQISGANLNAEPIAPSTSFIEEPEAEATPAIDAPALKLFEAEVVDKILQKSDDLASSLAKMQEQYDRTERELNDKIAAARIEAKEQGDAQGYARAKTELEGIVNAQKELYGVSIARLEAEITRQKEHVASLEKELTSIALDIAREVIVAETAQNSAKVASALARALLEDVAAASDVVLKVFPGDLEDLKESLKDLQNIKLEADVAIAKGGVVITSSEGNIDGSVMLRFETLKKSILGQ